MQCQCGCGKEIVSTRADAKYYSAACRKAQSRKGVTSSPGKCDIQPKAVTENPESVTQSKSVTEPTNGFISAADLIEPGKIIAQRKLEAMKSSDLATVTPNAPCQVPIKRDVIDIEKDLGLNLKRDLGCDSWTENGIMIRPDISINQAQSIARLIHARHGRPTPAFRSC